MTAPVVLVSPEELAAIVERAVERALKRTAPEVMTVEQAAAHVGRAPKTIRAWVAAGLPVVRKGRRVHVRREDLAAWLSRDEATPDAIVASLRRAG